MPLPAETVGAGREADRNNRRSSTRSSASGDTAGGVPRVGGVRCYWAFLRPIYPRPDVPGSKLELVFVHPDPVLGAHLAKQKMSLMGRGVIEFIHPHEREQARQDLKSAISLNDLQGSVTRVRFARLSRLKIILGCPPEDIEYPDFEWQKLVVDEDYLVLDLVLNWVADGMLLAFFHAITDLDPIANNDPNRRDEGWSNFCGTANIDAEQIAALSKDIANIIPAPQRTRFPPTRVFQLHAPATPTSPSTLLFSWPPARQPGSYARYDGLYDAEEYTALMRGVPMDPHSAPLAAGDIRTTCTTRFGAQHGVRNEGVERIIASTFIPYGNLVFACFQTIQMFDAPDRQEYQSLAGLYGQDWQGGAGPSGSSASTYNAFPPQQQYMTPGIPHQPPPPMASVPPALYPISDIVPPAPYTAGPSSASSGWSSERDFCPNAFFPHLSPSQPNPPFSSSPMQTATSDHDSPFSPFSQPHLPIHPMAHPVPPHLPDLPHPLPPQSPTTHMPPPPIPPFPPVPHDQAAQKPELKMEVTSPNMGSTRPLIRPPGDVECCVACGTRESPEWRRSESGIKDLCNACGLRLARQVAKREGKQKPRKKKEK